jgi:hypothetical protein
MLPSNIALNTAAAIAAAHKQILAHQQIVFHIACKNNRRFAMFNHIVIRV